MRRNSKSMKPRRSRRRSISKQNKRMKRMKLKSKSNKYTGAGTTFSTVVCNRGGPCGTSYPSGCGSSRVCSSNGTGCTCVLRT
jgi:hypothetical protein